MKLELKIAPVSSSKRVSVKSLERMSVLLSLPLFFGIQWIFTTIKFLTHFVIRQDFFGSSDVHEFLFGFFLFFFILEVVWMPLLSQFPVGFVNFLFACVSTHAQDFVVISFTGLFLPFLCSTKSILGWTIIFIKL